jgi:hypothetical protein
MGVGIATFAWKICARHLILNDLPRGSVIPYLKVERAAAIQDVM